MRRDLVGNLVLGLVLTALTAPVLGDDIVHPWWRDDARTTYERWEFGENVNPVPADEYRGEFATPQASLPNGKFWPEMLGRTGVWALTGQIFAEVENYPEPLDEKWIWVQLTWAPEDPGNRPIVEAWVETDTGTTEQGVIVSEISLEEPWMHTTFQILLTPNPVFETIHIDNSVYVDQLVVVTICIPEPATLSLLTLASLAAMHHKRKRTIRRS